MISLDKSRMFLGIGAQKCASTWLHDILADHPEVCLPHKSKEVDFFSYHYDFGLQWYERHFEKSPRHTISGEISPSYLHDLAAPRRVAGYNPAMRMIALLREPVARLISNHKHEVRLGHFTGPDLSLESGLRNNGSYVEQGKYATHLERWFEAFPREQFLLLLFDDIVANPEGSARRIYDFLGIDAGHRSAALTGRSNESYVPRSRRLEACKDSIRSIVRNAGLGRAWTILGHSGVKKVYRRLNRQPPEAVIPAPEAATLAELRRTFSGEVLRLEKILGKTLESWR